MTNLDLKAILANDLMNMAVSIAGAVSICLLSVYGAEAQMNTIPRDWSRESFLGADHSPIITGEDRTEFKGVRTQESNVVPDGGLEIGPSFDCRRAKRPSSEAICRDAGLARLDIRMKNAFISALRVGSDSKVLRLGQRAWLANRDRCGSDSECLRSSMESRIVELGGVTDTTSLEPDAGKVATRSQRNSLLTWMSPPNGFGPWHFNLHDNVPVVSDLSLVMRIIEAANNSNYLDRNIALIARTMLKPDTYRQTFTDMGFIGHNEFEVDRAKSKFISWFEPALRSIAPQAPFDVIIENEIGLQNYDRSRGGYSLAGTHVDLLIQNSAMQAGVSVALAFAPPEYFWHIEPQAAEHVLAALGNARNLILAAGLRFRSLGSDGVLHVGLQSLKIYVPGENAPIGEITVANDDTAFAESDGESPLRFNVAPTLDDVLACAEFLNLRDDTLTNSEVQPCWNAVRDRDNKRYADPAAFAQLTPSDAVTPFFPRAGLPLNTENRTRFLRWARSYTAAAAASPTVTYMSQQSLRTSEGLTFLAVGAPGGDTGRVFSRLLGAEHLRGEQVVPLGPIGGLSVIAILPNLTQRYGVAVPRSMLNEDSDGGAVPTAFLRLGPAKLVQDDLGRQALAIWVTPLNMLVTARRGGAALASQGFGAVPRFGGAISAETSSESALKLDSAMIDLLVAKTMASRLPPEALSYMVTRRWLYENSNVDSIDRFFAIGQPRPDADAAAAAGSAFLDWARDHGPTLPTKVTVSGSFEVSRGQEDLQWDRLPCFAASFATLMAQNGADTASKAQAGDCGRNETVVSPNERADCSRSQTDAALRPFLKELGGVCRPNISLGFADPLHVYAKFDRAALALPKITALGGKQSVSATIVLILQGVSAPGHNRNTADLSGDPSTAAVLASERSSAPLPIALLDLQFQSASFQDARTQARLESPSLDSAQTNSDVLRRRPSDGMMPSSKPETTDAAYGPDLVGVRLGMTLDEAERAVRAHMTVGRVLQGERASAAASGQSLFKPLTSGRLFISDDDKEMLAVFDEPPAVTGRVVGAWRRIYIPAETVASEEVFAGLKKKFGSPTAGLLEKGVLAQWATSSGSRCRNLYDTTKDAPLTDSWYEDGHLATMSFPSGVPPIGPQMVVALFEPLSERYQQWSNCGPIVTSFYLQWRGRLGSIDQLDMTLTDLGPYMHAYGESGRQLQGSDRSDHTAGPPIKF